MIHTLTLLQRVNQKVFAELYQQRTTSKDSYGRIHDQIITLGDKGITFELYRREIESKNSKKSYQHFVFLRLNPGKVLGGNCLSVFNPARYEELKTRYHELTSEQFCVLCDLDTFMVRRIDYCVQLRLDDVPRYVLLMQRGWMPKRGNFTTKQDPQKLKDNHRAKSYEAHHRGSVYYTGGKRATATEPFKHGSYNVNFYDKMDEMITAKKYTAEQIAAAENVLRLEVQCKKRKVDNIAKKYGFKDKTMSQYLSLDIAKHIIQSVYTEIVGEGNYIKKQDAITLIKHNVRTENVQNRLIQILDNITGHGGTGNSLWTLYDAIEDVKQKRVFRDDVKHLNELGINAVPLPSTYPQDELPNLLPAIQQYFADIDTPFVDDIPAADDLDIEDLLENEE